MGVWFRVLVGVLALGCSPPEPAQLVESTSWQLAREQGRFVDVHGMQMFALTQGPANAPHVILLHGNPDSIRAWRAVFDPLAERYRVHAIDQIGYGFSDKPDRAPYDPSWHARNLVAYMDAAGIERASLVGNSMGGHVATETAIRHPGRVDALVLLGASGLPEEQESHSGLPWVVRLLQLPWMDRLAPWIPAREILRRQIAPAYYDPTFLSEEMLDEWYRTLRSRGALTAYLARLSQPVPPERVDRVRRIRAPTLVISGDTDRLVPVEVARRYHELILNSELLILEATGHIPQEERPTRIVAEVRRWVDARR